jgi:2-amino-4-hydroxy-6-hydroxymethyldihydropteridine diphosphokinase
VSGVYRSRAVGPGQQPDYLNAVAELQTALSPLILLDHLQQIEQQQGRVRLLRWGARTLDLDLLLYGDEQVQLPGLTVPHNALPDRNFVLYPLAEIAGLDFLLPGGTELGTLVAACPRAELTRTNHNLCGE